MKYILEILQPHPFGRRQQIEFRESKDTMTTDSGYMVNDEEARAATAISSR
jgi:hypothetical protein